MKKEKMYIEPISHILQKSRRKKGILSFVDNRIQALSQKELLNTIQKKNGARLVNWRTSSINENDGIINHNLNWDSSTGLLGDLDDVYTREHVEWSSGCPWASNNYSEYLQAGEHFGYGSSKADMGVGQDSHQCTQPYPDEKKIMPGKKQNFVMTQVYQYSLDGTTYNDIPNSNYILERNLSRGRWFSKNHYTSTLTKSGVGEADVNCTTMKIFTM